MGLKDLFAGFGVSKKLGNDLLEAVRRDADVVEVIGLLDAGAPVDCKNRKGNTALHIAASHANIPLARALIVRGAGLDERNERRETALSVAWRGYHQETAEMIEAAVRRTRDMTEEEITDRYAAVLKSVSDDMNKPTAETQERARVAEFEKIAAEIRGGVKQGFEAPTPLTARGKTPGV